MKIKTGYIQKAQCSECKTKREIHRREKTDTSHKFYCAECQKDVRPV